MSQKETETEKPPSPPDSQPTPPPMMQQISPQQQNQMFAQAIGDISIRLTNSEIAVKKNDANLEIMGNRIDLLKKTIDLLEKQVEFNDQKKNQDS